MPWPSGKGLQAIRPLLVRGVLFRLPLGHEFWPLGLLGLLWQGYSQKAVSHVANLLCLKLPAASTLQVRLTRECRAAPRRPRATPYCRRGCCGAGSAASRRSGRSASRRWPSLLMGSASSWGSPGGGSESHGGEAEVDERSETALSKLATWSRISIAAVTLLCRDQKRTELAGVMIRPRKPEQTHLQVSGNS